MNTTWTRIWAWISRPRNQKTITFFGGGLTVLVAAIWTVFTHVVDPRTDHRATEINQSLTGSGTAIVQTGNGSIYVSSTKGISAEDYARIAADLGVTQTALRVFFHTVETKQVKTEDIDKTLREIAGKYNALRKELESLSGDSATTELREQARKALEEGDFDRAESFLMRIPELNVEVANKLKESAVEHLIVAAAALADLGKLKSSQLAFSEEATYYRRAAELVPVSPTNTLRAEYLYREGKAAFVAGNLVEAERAILESIADQKRTKSDKGVNYDATVNALAALYQHQGRYSEAEIQYQRVLASIDKKGGKSNFWLVADLEGLAIVYRKQGRYSQALAVLNRAKSLLEEAQDPNQFLLATTLSNMGTIYGEIGSHVEAEKLMSSALKIVEKEFGVEHIAVAPVLNNLGTVYEAQGRYADAERNHLRALAIMEKYFGSKHIELGNVLNNLMTVSAAQKKYEDAESYGRRALNIRETVLGQIHPDVAVILGNLAGLYSDQGRYAEAEESYQRALTIQEKTLGPTHPNVVLSQGNLAMFYASQGRNAEADRNFLRAIVRSERLVNMNPYLPHILDNYGWFLRKTGHQLEAKEFEERARKLLVKGPKLKGDLRITGPTH
jgi:tetratricopeptide (TPR) repeat protein